MRFYAHPVSELVLGGMIWTFPAQYVSKGKINRRLPMRVLTKVLIAISLSMPTPGQANATTPQEVVEETSNRVMTVWMPTVTPYKDDTGCLVEGLK